MDLTDAANVLLQLPVVGLFVWVVFRLLDRHREEASARDARFLAELGAERAAREANSAAMRESLAGNAARTGAGLTELAAGVRELRDEVRRHG